MTLRRRRRRIQKDNAPMAKSATSPRETPTAMPVVFDPDVGVLEGVAEVLARDEDIYQESAHCRLERSRSINVSKPASSRWNGARHLCSNDR